MSPVTSTTHRTHLSVRVLAAVAALVSAFAHLSLWMGTMREIRVVGQSFLVNAVAGVVIAVLLLVVRHSWVPAFLVLGFGLATLGALVVATTFGLFGYHETWTGPYVWVTAVAEVVCIVAGGALLASVLRSGASHEDHLA